MSIHFKTSRGRKKVQMELGCDACRVRLHLCRPLLEFCRTNLHNKCTSILFYIKIFFIVFRRNFYFVLFGFILLVLFGSSYFCTWSKNTVRHITSVGPTQATSWRRERLFTRSEGKNRVPEINKLMASIAYNM